MDLSSFANTPELLSGYIDGVTFEPWKQMAGDASAISICTITTPQVLILKGEHLVRLAYPIRTTFMRGGKVRATFAVNSKTAMQIVKLENTLKDRLGSSGMMKKAEIKSTFQSCVSAPSPKYPSHTVAFDLRVEAPKSTLYQMIENPNESGWNTVPINFDEVSKFSLMSLRIAPTLLWKGNGKCAIKWMVKQGVVAYEDEIPPPVDEANIDVTWDELEDQDFLNDMANASMGFTADKLVPKGLKAVKGAKACADLDEFSTVSVPVKKSDKKPAAKKKAIVEPASVDDEEGGEEVLELDTMDAGKVKKPTNKRPRTIKTLDTEDIPEGKITLPSTGDAIMMEAEDDSE